MRRKWLARWAAAELLVALGAVILLQDNYAANAFIWRWKRQSCRQSQFQCASGECVAQFLICDGEVNCRDGSDETQKACSDIQCPIYAFRCEYGACIEGDKKCDGKNNCADGSDEKDCGVSGELAGTDVPAKATNCKNQYTCKSGSCIDPFLLCDGMKDCDDGSDETHEVCASFTCPAFAFQCEYGACVMQEALCDGQAQCADATDEHPRHCAGASTTPPPPTPGPSPAPALRPAPTTGQRPAPAPALGQRPTPGPAPRPTSPPPPPFEAAGCKLPGQPPHGRYRLGGCDPPACRPVPGARVLAAFLLYACDPGFQLAGAQVLLCDAAAWSAPFPVCDAVACPPLNDPSRDIECRLNDEIVDCTQRMPPGTKASVRCNSYYSHGPEFSSFDTTCQPSGQWSRDVTSCVPRCGDANPDGVPFISHGRRANFAEYPWHVGLYRPADGILKQVCGGSIISERVIITAAHCFWDDSTSLKVDYKDDKVAVGKYYLDWYNKTKYVQTPEIDHVVLHDHFKGRQRRYENDIALITLKETIRMTQAVRPICVDFDKEYINHFSPGTKGIVVGWGITERMKQSETLHTATLPHVDFRSCEKEVPESFQSFLTYDKFCAGYRNGTSVCPGDSGGGYASQFRDGKWYLMGIVSVGVPSNNADDCNILQYTTFTRVSEHYEFIRKNKGH